MLMMTKMTMVPCAALLLTFSLGLAPTHTKSEVWSIDQSDSAGKTYGGTIYIWDAKDLEKVNKQAAAEKVDLGDAAAALCMAQTGANPVRPHMLTMNRASTHAIISFVASGHVLFMDARSRQPITCIRTSLGSTGFRHNRPGDLHDSQRRPLPACRHSSGQCANLPDYRFHRCVEFRDAARRWIVRRRREADPHAHRGRV
jgi:hypothetical protein